MLVIRDEDGATGERQALEYCSGNDHGRMIDDEYRHIIRLDKGVGSILDPNP
jgi:hypothetical protein